MTYLPRDSMYLTPLLGFSYHSPTIAQMTKRGPVTDSSATQNERVILLLFLRPRRIYSLRTERQSPPWEGQILQSKVQGDSGRGMQNRFHLPWPLGSGGSGRQKRSDDKHRENASELTSIVCQGHGHGDTSAVYLSSQLDVIS